MKIVVLGGTGLVGSNVVRKLAARGHEAVPASPDTGVNTLTGQGLDEALDAADVVVSVSRNNPFPSPRAGPIRDADAVSLFGEVLATMRVRLLASIDTTAPDPVTQGVLIGVADQLDKLAWMIGAHGGRGGDEPR